MAEALNWQGMHDLSARVLEERTGEGVQHWVARMKAEAPADEAGLKAWLLQQGVTGYARSMLVREMLGYPPWMTASADELIDAQYAERPALRPIYDAVIAAALALGDVTVQSRKTYVSLLTPKRTFARVLAGRAAVQVALRLQDHAPGGRLHPSRIQETMPVELRLARIGDLDDDARALLEAAYERSC
jgi:hypothetical protein